jgi:hypothetical protein
MQHGKLGKEATTSDQIWRPTQASRLCHQIEEGRRFRGKSVAAIHGACGKGRRKLRWRLGPDENVQPVMYVYAQNHETDERSADHISQHRAIADYYHSEACYHESIADGSLSRTVPLIRTHPSSIPDTVHLLIGQWHVGFRTNQREAKHHSRPTRWGLGQRPT